MSLDNPFEAPPDALVPEPEPVAALTSREAAALAYVHGTVAPKALFALCYGAISLTTMAGHGLQMVEDGLAVGPTVLVGVSAFGGIAAAVAGLSALQAFRAHERRPVGILEALEAEQIFWQVMVLSLALFLLTCGGTGLFALVAR